MAGYPNVNAANRYAREIVAGKIPASKLTRLACQRHLDDLEHAKAKDYPYKFDRKKAEEACEFIQMLPHTKGEWAAKRLPITLEPWQLFGVASIFGWVRKKDNYRRFRIVYIEVPRKNGKSAKAAGIGNKCFCADGEFGAEVYSGATTEKQAWEVFRPARLMVNRTPDLIEAFGVEVNAGNMNIPADGARFEPIVGNPGDGQSPSCAIVDEYHEHDSRELFDTMLSGMGARRQPLLFVITTAGYNIGGPCYEQRQKVIEMLEGLCPDDELFGLIYTIDEGDDWTDPAVLAKANPNMGVSVFRDYLEAQQRRAINDPGFAVTFKTKHLNVWCSARSAYFNMEAWKACADPNLRIEDLLDLPCLLPLDMAEKTDICAAPPIFYREIDGKTHYYCASPQFWLPHDTIWDPDKKASSERYQRWLAKGWLNECEGAEVDFNEIRDHVLALHQRCRIEEVPHDPWGAFQIARDLEAEGLTPVKIPQNTQHLSPAMKELNAAILSGRFHHDGNPVMTWMIGNVTAKPDANDNVFPRKDKPELKIDGPVALMLGIGRAMVLEPAIEPGVIIL